MRFGENKTLILRRVMLALIIVGAAVLQNACGTLKVPFAARPLLLIPLCVCASMFESNTASALFGAFGGILWDVSASCDGFNAVVIMLFGAGCSLLISHFMRNNIVTALVLCGSATAVYELIYSVIFHAFRGVSPFAGFFTYNIPAFLLTALFIPVCYFAVKLIYGNGGAAANAG